MRYHLTLLTVAIINKTRENKSWHGCGEKGNLVHCWWDCKLLQPLWKTVWKILKNLKLQHHRMQQFHFWEYIQRKFKHKLAKIICTSMFIAVLFAMAKTWKPPKFPSMNDWGKKLWCMYTMESYSSRHLVHFLFNWIGHLYLLPIYSALHLWP